MLDAGAVLNYPLLVAHSRIRAKKLHILTLVPEGTCCCVDGASHIYDDLRSIPISRDFYDIIACITTLEHIGMDNTSFNGPSENAADDYLIAVREMRRVLKPGGVFLLTVPFGPYRNFGSFQLFDKRLIENVVSAFAPASVNETYFRCLAQGWSLSDVGACADVEYVPWIMQSPEKRPAQFPAQPGNAAAARASHASRWSSDLRGAAQDDSRHLRARAQRARSRRRRLQSAWSLKGHFAKWRRTRKCRHRQTQSIKARQAPFAPSVATAMDLAARHGFIDCGIAIAGAC